MAPVVVDEKAGMGHVEEVGSANSVNTPTARPTTTGGKIKRHFRKWWWVHLILFLAGALIISLCLVYVAFPRIAQNDINDSTLSLNSLELSNPTSTSFHLTQNATITNNSPYHPVLDAFNASFSIHQTGDAYIYVELPEILATQTAISIVDQDVTITNLSAFTDYNLAVLNQESLQVDVNGSTNLHEMKFPTTGVSYNAVSTVAGFNKFDGFNVTSFEIKIPAESDGTNMVGYVYIPNPSVFTLHMGNVSFGNYLPATPYSAPFFIGNSTLENVILRPGNNTFQMKSVINQTLVLDAIGLVYKDGILPVDIVGAQSVYNGQHLTYFEAALQSLTQHVKLDVGSALKAATSGGKSGGTKRARRHKRD